MSFGRPTKYKPEFCQLLMEHMKLGYSFECFGAEVLVTEKTLYNWVDKYPDFLQSKRLGEKLCQKWWEKLGRGIVSGKIQGNAAVYIFNMKNRFNWSDKREVALSGSVEINSITDLLIESEREDDVIDITPDKKMIVQGEPDES